LDTLILLSLLPLRPFTPLRQKKIQPYQQQQQRGDAHSKIGVKAEAIKKASKKPEPGFFLAKSHRAQPEDEGEKEGEQDGAETDAAEMNRPQGDGPEDGR
jgi:hypothetical protein